MYDITFKIGLGIVIYFRNRSNVFLSFILNFDEKFRIIESRFTEIALRFAQKFSYTIYKLMKSCRFFIRLLYLKL